MLRTIYGDPKRYLDQYWSQIPRMYFTGNVSGHRLSTI
jgi:acetyl-CoA synthetase